MSLQDQLRELFLLDQQVRGLRSRLDAALRRKKAQQNKLDQLQQQQSELEDQLKHAQVKSGSLEEQAQGIEERVGRLREQMNTAKNNKEYSARLVEVNTLKLEKSKLEDQALEQMSEVDSLKQRLEEVTGKIDEQRKLVEGAQADADSAQQEVGDRLEKLTSERDAAAEAVPPEPRATFERLTDAFDEGDALAPVHEQDRRRMEYTCGGCYMSLPIERVNTLMMRPDELVTCPNCSRILYIDQELKAAIGSK